MKSLSRSPLFNFLSKFKTSSFKKRRLRAVFFVFLWMFSFNLILAAEKININAAPYEELQKIIWVGPVTAQRIIDARPFYSLDEITRVSGIGDKKLEDIKKQGLAWAGPTLETEREMPPAVIKEKQFIEPTKPENTSKAEVKEDSYLNIDINTASPEELQKIIGIGAVLSQRIIDMRPFCCLDDLAKVHGIGEATLKNIKNQGLAWVDPGLTSSKTEKAESPDKNLAAVSLPLRQIRETQDKEFSERSPVLLAAFALSFFSAITVLFLKKNFKAAP